MIRPPENSTLEERAERYVETIKEAEPLVFNLIPDQYTPLIEFLILRTYLESSRNEINTLLHKTIPVHDHQ